MSLTTDLPRPALEPFSPAQVRFASAAWPMRAEQELRSALIFRALARASRAASFQEPWPSRFKAAVGDEIRHARLCAEVAKRLHAAPPKYDDRPVRARLAPLADARARAMSLLVIEVAIGETVSTYLFRAGRRAATEPLTRAALTAILRDEVRHQKLGWTALEDTWPTLGAAERESLQREATSGLALCENQTAVPAMRWLEERRPFDPAYAALGVLHPEERVESFYAAIERLVVPRLTRLGLDGERAWRDRYRVRRAG